MRVVFLDTQTKKMRTEDVNSDSLIDGNWSCDCNRVALFDPKKYEDCGNCLGCQRYVVVNAYYLDAPMPYLKTYQLVVEANQDYPIELQSMALKYFDRLQALQIRPMKSAPKDGTYILLFGDSGYTTTPYRCSVCRYDAKYRPLQPWVTYSGDSFLDSGGPPIGWFPIPYDAEIPTNG